MRTKREIIDSVASEEERLSGKYDLMTIGISIDVYVKEYLQEYKDGAKFGYVEGFKSAIKALSDSLPSVEEKLSIKTKD